MYRCRYEQKDAPSVLQNFISFEVASKKRDTSFGLPGLALEKKRGITSEISRSITFYGLKARKQENIFGGVNRLKFAEQITQLGNHSEAAPMIRHEPKVPRNTISALILGKFFVR